MTRYEKILKYLCEKDPDNYLNDSEPYYNTIEKHYDWAANRLIELKTVWLKKQLKKFDALEPLIDYSEELYPLIFGEDDIEEKVKE